SYSRKRRGQTWIPTFLSLARLVPPPRRQDYVYHQEDEGGRPVLDLGHVVHSLNRLDSGDPEKILLMSRDGHTMIIVSFQDVKRCLEAAWLEYCEIANPAAATPELGHLVGSEHEVPPQLVPAYMMGDIGHPVLKRTYQEAARLLDHHQGNYAPAEQGSVVPWLIMWELLREEKPQGLSPVPLVTAFHAPFLPTHVSRSSLSMPSPIRCYSTRPPSPRPPGNGGGPSRPPFRPNSPRPSGGGRNRWGPPEVDPNKPPMNDALLRMAPGNVRVVISNPEDGDEMAGVMATTEALAKAKEMGLDLIMISETADPPVVKIIDYGKFKYSLEKKKKEQKKKAKTTEVKEVKMSYKIENHDYGGGSSNT
ncbi:hypothetical protein NGA_0369010, partial [Nannochloropsis gaditana CCMP526]|uniref:uncharacterized protein n=1 Tax=Nannochloropsis gaditana (strain CCMP526) TaxID=1093141 RepID=UPI00029F5610